MSRFIMIQMDLWNDHLSLVRVMRQASSAFSASASSFQPKTLKAWIGQRRHGESLTVKAFAFKGSQHVFDWIQRICWFSSLLLHLSFIMQEGNHSVLVWGNDETTCVSFVDKICNTAVIHLLEAANSICKCSRWRWGLHSRRHFEPFSSTACVPFGWTLPAMSSHETGPVWFHPVRLRTPRQWRFGKFFLACWDIVQTCSKVLSNPNANCGSFRFWHCWEAKTAVVELPEVGKLVGEVGEVGIWNSK